MAKSIQQFVGTAGTYFVAHCLSVRQLHAAITLGNAPGVDIIAARADGSNALSIQVKSRWAGCRCRWYRHEVWQWDVGRGAVGRSSERLLYAFVDYAESESTHPSVFLVPSKWVAETVGADWSRFIFPLRVECEKLTRERWDLLQGLLDSQSEAVAWASAVPPEARFTPIESQAVPDTIAPCEGDAE